MKARTELGALTGRLVATLYRENNKLVDSTPNHQIPANKWGHLYRYATGNTVGGRYPMHLVIENMTRYAKTSQTREDILALAKDIADTELSNVSFYQYGVASVWMGKEFQVAFMDAMFKDVTGV